jgi:hypothetical protein
VTTHRERALGQARADLVALPGLVDELARCLNERGAAAGIARKVSGSPALVRLDVLWLLDPRRKPGWDGADPREENYTDWLGVAPLLESWVRVLWEDLPEILELTEVATVRSEASVLVEFWPFIETQQWADELAKDVSRAAEAVRRALGIRPDYQPKCRKCKSTVVPVEAETHRLTTWEACAYGACTGCDWTYPKGPALDALAQVQPGMTLAAISELTGIPVKTLHRWHNDGFIKPTSGPGQRRGRTFDLAAVREVASKRRVMQAS